MKSFVDRRIGLLALVVFLLTRALILLHDPIMTDVHMYYEVSKRSAWGAIEIYKDFPFAYPFLSWLAIFWPPLFDAQLTFETYQTSLHVFFFALEAGTVAAFFWTFRKNENQRQIFAKTLLIYSALSVFQLDLIYDRMDLLMTLSLMLIFCTWATTWLGASFIAGFELKLLPIMIWPLKFLETYKTNRRRALLSIWIPAAALAILFLSDYLFFDGELAALSNHSSRGIQIESLWANPFQALHILGFDPSGQIVNIFGAQEVTSDLLTPPLVFLSKSLGFLIIGVVYLFARIEMKTWAGRTRGFLLVLLSFLCFQRVLSTQFLLWLAPFLALSLALEFSWIYFSLSVAVFALTCFIFNPAYWDMVHYDPFFTTLLFARNFLLLVLFTLSFRRGLIAVND